MTTSQPLVDARDAIVAWAFYYLHHNAECHYSEAMGERVNILRQPPGALPVTCDCSMWYNGCYRNAGCIHSPLGYPYDTGLGYTGSELSAGQLEPFTNVLLANGRRVWLPSLFLKAGDAIVYGPGTGWHTAMVVVPGADPLTISMGEEGDPRLIRVSQDGRQPQRYLRFDTRAVVAHYPPGYAPKPPTITHPGGVTKPTPTPPNLELGASGQTVAFLQGLLNKKINAKLITDGQYGPMTQEAVKRLQAVSKLPVTGICDLATWRKAW